MVDEVSDSDTVNDEELNISGITDISFSTSDLDDVNQIMNTHKFTGNHKFVQLFAELHFILLD